MGRAVARRVGEDGLDFFAREVFDVDLLRREFLQHCLLFRGCRRLNPVIERLTEFARQFAVDFAGVPAHPWP